MGTSRGEELPRGLFQVRLEHCPRSKEETYERLHFYVSWLGVAVADSLQDCLLDLRRKAGMTDNRAVQRLLLKGYSDEEYVAAVKEILCIWLHLEVIDQGGEEAPEWLVSFLRLAFGCTDRLIAEPKAWNVLSSYEHCEDFVSLCRQTSMRVSRSLGFAEHAEGISPAFHPALIQSSSRRQQILEEALTLPLETIRTYAP